MKKITMLLAALFSFSGLAHEIEGTQVLKGALKTKLRVNNVKTTCKVKVAEVKNLMEEDQYGNPAYWLKLEVSLKGGEFFSDKRIDFNKTFSLDNLFEDGVRDLEYKGRGATLLIKDDGRLSQVKFAYRQQPVVCSF